MAPHGNCYASHRMVTPMNIPPPPRILLPSLRVMGGRTEIAMGELRKLVEMALSGVEVDESWYIRQYPDVDRAVQKSRLRSAKEHYLRFGYLEGRLPVNPRVDESWYRSK